MTTNKEHNENLNDEISFLGDATRNIYTVPKGYFEKLQESIEEKIIEADLNDLNLSNRNIYNMPDHYFDSVEPLKDEGVLSDTKVISIKKWRKATLLKIAASIAIIFSIGYYSSLFFNIDSSKNVIISNSNEYDFTISEYETGLFDETEDELLASLEFEDKIYFDNSFINDDQDLTVDELNDYLDSDFELNIEF